MKKEGEIAKDRNVQEKALEKPLGSSLSSAALLVMLYNTGIDFIGQAMRNIDQPKAFQLHLKNCQNVLHELSLSLDKDSESRLIVTLSELYDYMEKQIHIALRKKDEEILKEVQELMIHLKEIWIRILQEKGSSKKP